MELSDLEESLPTEAPTEASENCNSWCSINTSPWLVKCKWPTCNHCSNCESLQTPTEAPTELSDLEESLPTEAPTGASENCNSWCSINTSPWSVKCKWPTCNHCSDCEAVPTEAPTGASENCKSWCGINTYPWSVKCKWPTCNHCSNCEALQSA